MKKVTSLMLASFLLSSGLVFAEDVTQPQVTVLTAGAVTKAVEVGNKICPVSKEKVPAPGEKTDMGVGPVRVEYKGKIYNMCCPMCVKDFKKDP